MSIIKKIKEFISTEESRCGGTRFICPDEIQEMIKYLGDIAEKRKDSNKQYLYEIAIINQKICAWIDVLMNDNAIIKGERLRQMASDLFANKLDVKEVKGAIEELTSTVKLADTTQLQIIKELEQLKIDIKTLKKSAKTTKSKE